MSARLRDLFFDAAIGMPLSGRAYWMLATICWCADESGEWVVPAALPQWRQTPRAPLLDSATTYAVTRELCDAGLLRVEGRRSDDEPGVCRLVVVVDELAARAGSG